VTDLGNDLEVEGDVLVHFLRLRLKGLILAMTLRLKRQPLAMTLRLKGITLAQSFCARNMSHD